MLPSVRTPQLFKYPTETCTNVPDGAELRFLAPQQSSEPSGRRPQTFAPPTESFEKVPGGGVDSANMLAPQHATVPSLRMPHVLSSVVPMSVKVVSGESFGTAPSMRAPS